MYDIIVDEVTQTHDIEQVERNIRRRVATLAITWTRFCVTIQHFLELFTVEDATAFDVDHQQVARIMQTLSDPSTWSFLCKESMCEEIGRASCRERV